jgi:glycosyltransferase involved in cell wall biosynthesis
VTRVLVVSHAYSTEGPRRQMDALAQHVELRLVAPPIWEEIEWPTSGYTAPYLLELPRIRLFGHQYLLAGTDLGMRSFKPDLVLIDYQPWSIVFWQAMFAKLLFARDAKVISGAKKNTFRRYAGIAGRAKRMLAKVGLGLTDRVEAASEMAAEMCEKELGHPRSKTDVNTHVGVDTTIFRPTPRGSATPSGPWKIGYVGRLSAHKGLATLIDAVSVVRARGLPVDLLLLGEGEMRSDLEERAGSEPWLSVLEPVEHDEVAGFMAQIDMYVLPAWVLPDHEEHDAHALLQAMSSGVPVIGTRSGIIPEILTEGRGILAAPGDSEDLARAIGELAGDSVLRERLSTEARRAAVEEYSFEVVAQRKANGYRRLTEGGGGDIYGES